MKIIIKDSDTNLNLTFPSRIVLNKITAALATKMINKKAGEEIPPVTSGQLRALIREINRYRKKHKDWVLIEVNETCTGEQVIIKP